MACLHQVNKGIKNIWPKFSALLQEYAGKAIGDLKRPIRSLVLLDAPQYHFVGRQVAFIRYAFEDPSVLSMVEVKVRQIGDDLLMQRSAPEEILV
jgi:hypothetical protein